VVVLNQSLVYSKDTNVFFILIIEIVVDVDNKLVFSIKHYHFNQVQSQVKQVELCVHRNTIILNGIREEKSFVTHF